MKRKKTNLKRKQLNFQTGTKPMKMFSMKKKRNDSRLYEKKI